VELVVLVPPFVRAWCRAADDALKRQGMEIRFRVRETPDWKLHAAELDTEMLGRGMMFEVIDWSEDQATPPFEE
jgi:hypothetical protein